MASSYTDNSGIELIGVGEQSGTWGTTTNNNLEIIDKVLNGLWSEKDADTDRKKGNREEILSSVRSLYANRKNAGGFGYNGWSLFNAVGEYYDHHWFDDEARNAAASMQIGNKSHLMKVKAADLILSLD